jgi:hypothetical protein
MSSGLLSTKMMDQSLSIIKWVGSKISMAISVPISCLHLDKRKCLMSLLESRNDMVRCLQQAVEVQFHSECYSELVP